MIGFVYGFRPVIGAVVDLILALLAGISVAGFRDCSATIAFSTAFFIAAVFTIGDGLPNAGFTGDTVEYLLTLISLAHCTQSVSAYLCCHDSLVLVTKNT